MDRIVIKEISARCIIGVNPDERRKKQDVLITVALYGDFSQAIAADSIDAAIDYKKVKDSIVNDVESSSFQLIESLAEAVSKICLANGDVWKVEVIVEKPGALSHAKSVCVEISRERQ